MRESHDDTLSKVSTMFRASKKKGLDKGVRSILMSHSRDMYKYDVLPPAKKFLLAIKEDRIDIMEENLWAAIKDLETNYRDTILDWGLLAINSKKSKGESIRFIVNPRTILKIVARIKSFPRSNIIPQNFIRNLLETWVYNAIDSNRPDIFELLLEELYLSTIFLTSINDWLHLINLKKWIIPDILFSIIKFSLKNDLGASARVKQQTYSVASRFSLEEREKLWEIVKEAEEDEDEGDEGDDW